MKIANSHSLPPSQAFSGDKWECGVAIKAMAERGAWSGWAGNQREFRSMRALFANFVPRENKRSWEPLQGNLVLIVLSLYPGCIDTWSPPGECTHVSCSRANLLEQERHKENSSIDNKQLLNEVEQNIVICQWRADQLFAEAEGWGK